MYCNIFSNLCCATLKSLTSFLFCSLTRFQEWSPLVICLQLWTVITGFSFLWIQEAFALLFRRVQNHRLWRSRMGEKSYPRLQLGQFYNIEYEDIHNWLCRCRIWMECGILVHFGILNTSSMRFNWALAFELSNCTVWWSRLRKNCEA